MVFKDGKVLLGERLGSHGAGSYASPGGHLEYMESFEDCARRETMEETGIEIQNIRLLRVSNLKEYAPKHYVHISLAADWKSGEPRAMEPEKCAKWEWFDPEHLPENLFATLRDNVVALRTGQVYWDA